MNPLLLKVLSYAVVAVISFGTGWKVNSWKNDSEQLAIETAKTEMINAYRAAERGQARILEDKLASLKANERVIEREKFKIITRDVYLHDCLDADGLRLIESARSGTTNPAKPAD